MSQDRSIRSLVAVDVGNTRAKWAVFQDGALVMRESVRLEDLDRWNPLSESEWVRRDMDCFIGSVNRTGSEKIADWCSVYGFRSVRVLEKVHLPLKVDLEDVSSVGIDRLLNAVSVNHMESKTRAALVVDCGSAITVDVVSASGHFVGGAIAPGLGVSAKGLHQFTDALPLVELPEDPGLETRGIGRTTTEAIQSGVFWGAVGAVGTLIDHLESELEQPCDIWMTGGDASLLQPHLLRETVLEPELTLLGIFWSAISGAR